MVESTYCSQKEDIWEIFKNSETLEGEKYQIDEKLSIVYQSDIMKQVMGKVQQANKIRRPVLITGETGRW